MSTGPTGPDESVRLLVGLTGPTGPSPYVLAMFPNASTGTAPAPMVVDIDELLSSYEAVKVQEDADRVSLSAVSSQTREALRPQMFAWAAAGFPTSHIVQQISVNPPNVCSDGVSRPDVAIYVTYLLGREMGDIIASVQALCVGVLISYSFQGNTLRIHVSKV